jgi:hypothetical protein
MKSFLVILITLFSIVHCYAGGVMMMGGGVPVVAGGFCSTGCTGDLVFCWGIDGDAVTGDSITLTDGCSAGDATVTFNSGTTVEPNPSGSGYALYFPTSSDTGLFDVTTDDILDDTVGTFQADIYVTTWADLTGVLRVFGQIDTDFVRIRLSGTDEITISHEGNNAGTVTATTGAANMVINGWYTITGKWRTGVTDPSLSITANASTGTSTTDLTEWAIQPSQIQLGRPDGVAGVLYMKNIKIWKAWQ